MSFVGPNINPKNGSKRSRLTTVPVQTVRVDRLSVRFAAIRHFGSSHLGSEGQVATLHVQPFVNSACPHCNASGENSRIHSSMSKRKSRHGRRAARGHDALWHIGSGQTGASRAVGAHIGKRDSICKPGSSRECSGSKGALRTYGVFHARSCK